MKAVPSMPWRGLNRLSTILFLGLALLAACVWHLQVTARSPQPIRARGLDLGHQYIDLDVPVLLPNTTLHSRQTPSDSQAVIQDLAGSNGQQCFKYTGKCVNLDDNNAMAAACGPGNTVVGWDDDGCGTKKCHCGKPICCPEAGAPKDCQWRGDNNGGGSSSDCNAQCLPGETNVAGIQSSYGGGFLNDGNTNKCGRGRKAFCCPNPDASQVTLGCSYAKCGASCDAGYTELFSKIDGCALTSQKYCCPDPVQLKDCHWTGGKGGQDCSNAVCSPTELEIDRAQFGGSSIGGCSWGRQKASCCTVQKTPPKPASCSADLCSLLPGFCPSDSDDESANGWKGKRDLEVIHRNSSRDHYDEYTNQLEKRAEIAEYQAVLYTGAIVVVRAAAYPAIGKLYEVANKNQIINKAFRLIPGYCIGPAVQAIAITAGTPGALFGLQSEHPIDRQIMAEFIVAASAGLLRGQPQRILPAIGAHFFEAFWNAQTPALSNLPPIGSAKGISPDTINNRIMESFGSTKWPEPFLPTDASINGAKGRVMKLEAATAIDTITSLARAAVRTDTTAAADALLQAVRVGFSVFDYINNPDVSARWNLVRKQIHTQFGYIEQVFGVQNLQAWWLLFTADYFTVVEDKAQTWADQAITAAMAPFIEADEAGTKLVIAASVKNTLTQWLNSELDLMVLPDSSSLGSMTIPSLP